MTRRSAVDKRWRLPALFMALALAAAACGADGDDTATSTDGAAASQNAEDDAMEEDEATNEDDAMEDESPDDAMEDEAMADGGTVTVTIENIADFPLSESGVFAVPADGTPVSGDVTAQIFTFDAGTEADQAVGEGADQAPRQSGPDTGAEDPDRTVRSVDRDASNYVGVLLTPGDDGRFDVRVENVSAMATVPSPIAPGVYVVHDQTVSLFEIGRADPGNGLEALAEDGDPSALGSYLAASTATTTPIAPGVWATHDGSVALFELGAPDAGLGLEALAEDGDAAELGEAVGSVDGVAHSGVFNTPVDAVEPGPALPGDSYSFEVPVGNGRLSFATMFVQSNDWIFATPPRGLALQGLDGDISDRLLVVDVGTEVDQPPGFGADQAPRQSGPNVGADDDDPDARLVADRSAARYIKVTVEPS